ncbi:hypothetical protein AAFF_G00413490 [Aldrovandia affinis]|uniref:Uncharacterized protein n=1 Tax=Aldrovandia affinis TaxID=143900 RepID=A0AAD7WJG9_9TELE|nr:hypothetical protein AAFF_G00413490 [Aldrovandia affinis]
MGLGSLVHSLEQQHSKEFLPEIVPVRAASPPLFPLAAATIRLGVTPRQSRWELADEVISPRLWKNRDRRAISLSAVRLKQAPVLPRSGKETSPMPCDGYMKTP